MKELFARLTFKRGADSRFATAKAINRKCPPYMFKESWR